MPSPALLFAALTVVAVAYGAVLWAVGLRIVQGARSERGREVGALQMQILTADSERQKLKARLDAVEAAIARADAAVLAVEGQRLAERVGALEGGAPARPSRAAEWPAAGGDGVRFDEGEGASFGLGLSTPPPVTTPRW